MALGLLAACSSQPERLPEPVSAPPRAEMPASPVVSPKAPIRAQVAILVSSDIPAYSDIAAALQRRLGARTTVFQLEERPLDTQALQAKLAGPVTGQVVAIGLEAALAARPLQQAGHPVVFCQVFNFLEHDLATARMKGVSLLPSHAQTFAAWKAIAPALARVGVFTGPGLEEMLAPAVREAARLGITLQHVTVDSDKDFLYSYKRKASELDGLWLLPDNRILSRSAIQDVMSYSVRNSKQVAVFNEQLLKIGGLFSVTSQVDDIATRVLQRLASVRPDGVVDGPVMLELQQVELRINPVIAERLNLRIPPKLQHYVLR